MEKILIVNDNLDMGGVQKSLVNLLNSISDDYDITLLLFCDGGVLEKEIPRNVHVQIAPKRFRILGATKQKLKKTPFLFLLKAVFVCFTKLFSKELALRILYKGIRFTGYDTVISYSHLTGYKSFQNGVGEFVINSTYADNKVCFIHCDYQHSNTKSEKNNTIYSRFDKLAFCSDSVCEAMLTDLPEMRKKAYTVRNFPDCEISSKAFAFKIDFDNSCINLLSVGRLSPEKGFLRVMQGICESGRKDIKYYVIGDGPNKEELKNYILENHLDDQIFLLGEKDNPYPYILSADYLMLSSYHEAAPMVFDEAFLLGTPIISTSVISAKEMLQEDNDIICENSQYGITTTIQRIHKPAKSEGCIDDRISKFIIQRKKAFAKLIK